MKEKLFDADGLAGGWPLIGTGNAGNAASLSTLKSVMMMIISPFSFSFGDCHLQVWRNLQQEKNGPTPLHPPSSVLLLLLLLPDETEWEIAPPHNSTKLNPKNCSILGLVSTLDDWMPPISQKRRSNMNST